MTSDSAPVEEPLARWLAPAARVAGVELSAAHISALARYALRLLEWNERINLSGARDLETLAREHLADALALLPHLPRAGRCLDVGSGAGLPGIVLAIVRRDLEFQLLEPSGKRRAFLAGIARELGLTNVSISGERDSAHLGVSGAAYDFAVARAVFPLGTWLAKGAAFVRPGGVVVGLAGGEAPKLGSAAQLELYDVGAGLRTLVLVRK